MIRSALGEVLSDSKLIEHLLPFRRIGRQAPHARTAVNKKGVTDK